MRARRARELLKNYLASHPDIHLEYLPPYLPCLNPQERIWHQVRHKRTNPGWFPSLDEAWKAIRGTSRRWSVEKAKLM